MKNMEKMMKTMEKNILWSDPLTPVLRLEKKGMLCMRCVALALNNFCWCFRAAWSPLASGDQEKIFPDQKKKPNLPLNLDEIDNIFLKILVV